jgi:hypothetical protein
LSRPAAAGGFRADSRVSKIPNPASGGKAHTGFAPQHKNIFSVDSMA